MKTLAVVNAVVLGFACTAIASQGDPAITRSDLERHVRILASDQFAGRGSGTEGNRQAAEYIIQQLRSFGIRPGGVNGYQQPFDFVSAVRTAAGNAASITGPDGTRTLRIDEDFRPLSFTEDATVEGSAVLAGFGISASDKDYDDYAGLDVNGKIVVAFRYAPDGSSARSDFQLYTSLRNKARTARDRGAAGFVLITGPADEPEDALLPMRFDKVGGSSGIPAVSMKRSVIEPYVEKAGWTLARLQDTIRAMRKPLSLELPDVRISISPKVEKVIDVTANVVGYLEGKDPVMKQEAIVLGAHFDHLGMGGPGSGSLAPDTAAIHNGADDNASGTAGLLELAERLAADSLSLRRTVVFVFFSGEELGTLGSAYYVSSPLVPVSSTVAMLNLDMVGRLKDNTLTVGGTGTSGLWPDLLNRENTDSALTLAMNPDGFGPSDHASFYAKNTPVLFFFTGIHDDYHRPSDDWETLDYPGEERVVRFVYRIARAVIDGKERPDFVRVQSRRPSMGGGDSRGFRVTLGIIPDYVEGGEGMKITGVRGGGPAEKAGLQSGDVIVKMAGKKVLNIYDYMGILTELKAGDVVEVAVLREGKPVTVTVTMSPRN